MNDHAIIIGDYVTFKHIKTRKQVILEIEVPEERFQEVISKLGIPIGGQSKPVFVGLMSNETHQKPTVPVEPKVLPPLRTYTLPQQAGMLCHDRRYWEYKGISSEEDAKEGLYKICQIKSRKELIEGTWETLAFDAELKAFDAWIITTRYGQNLERAGL